MPIPEMLASLRKELGYSQQQVAERLNTTRQSVSRWEKGDTEPSLAQFLTLCRLYGVSDVLTVFGDETGARALNDLGRQRMLEYLRLLQSNDKYLTAPRQKPMTRRIPLYDLPVSAGTGQFLDSDRYELIQVDESVPLDATYAVRVSGDSMAPRFAHGQVLYIKPQQTLERGETGIFLHNGEALCKELGGKDGAPVLLSLNPAYGPRLVQPGDELRVLGKVLK